MTVISAQSPSITAAPAALVPWRERAFTRLQTRVGRLAMVAAFTVMMFGLRMPLWWQTAIVLTLITLLPARRTMLVALAALAWIFLEPPVDFALLAQLAPAHAAENWLKFWPAGVAGAWLIAIVLLLVIRRFPTTPMARRPIVTLLLLYMAMLVIMSQAPLVGGAWFFCIVTTLAFGQYLWFFAYTIAENHKAAKPLCADEVGNWRPFWGFTGVPFGKGWTYLRRVEAKSDEQLTKVQLRGLKLMLRAIVMTAAIIVGHRLLYGPGGSLTRVPDLGTKLTNYLVPTSDMALDAMKAGEPYSLPMRWAALLTYFFLRITAIIIFGHKVIAVLRMAGYDAFRNTYRPFESTSIAEFYNRIYYYFKELLVTFFFFPSYLRYFKKNQKLRLFMATLAAAGLGNFLFHFLRDSEVMLRQGPLRALWFYRTYAVYALILGCAISFSQLRVLARKGPPVQGLRKYLAIAGVFLFYLLLGIIEEPNDRRGLSAYGFYFASLFRP
jgi:hypothetical protein